MSHVVRDVDTEDIWRQRAEDQRDTAILEVKHPRMKQVEMFDFYIAATHKQPLIGLAALLQFDLLSVNDENNGALNLNDKVKATPEFMCTNYQDLFEGYTANWMVNCIRRRPDGLSRSNAAAQGAGSVQSKSWTRTEDDVARWWTNRRNGFQHIFALGLTVSDITKIEIFILRGRSRSRSKILAMKPFDSKY